MQKDTTTSYHRLVIKLGTNLITGGKDKLNRDVMASLVEQVAQLNQRGLQTIVVSSGAVAAGKHRLGTRKKRRDTPFKQVLAAIGQGQLMQAYDELFGEREITVAQTLLTKPDFLNRMGYLNARNTLLALLDFGVVPIVNENDVVCVEELKGAMFGDNDNLSAMVASLVDADLLIILSDVAGLYTSEPGQGNEVSLIRRVEKIDSSIERYITGKSGERGTGGMATKLDAARLATASGTAVVIASGYEPDVISRIVGGEEVGTYFPPTHSKLESRKRWMLSQPAAGRIIIDAGAKTALTKQNRSLLPAGVVDVDGRFERGDVVAIVDSKGVNVFNGISNYSSEEILQVKGCRSDRIGELLGYGYGAEVVHRDNMVVL